jgi:hypothetical protein
MGSMADAYANVPCASFFVALEYELLDRWTFRFRNGARNAVFKFIESQLF